MSTTTTAPPLIDLAMPRYDVAARHETRVAAAPERVYAAARELDLGRAPLTRALFLLRVIPAVFSPAARRARKPRLGISMEGLLGSGFVLLEERPGRELLLGLVGRFWTLDGGLVRVTPAEFHAWDRPGYARATWSFSVAPAEGGGTRLATETRVLCTDPASARRFRRYWRVVGPFSGLIRSEMLRTVRRTAER